MKQLENQGPGLFAIVAMGARGEIGLDGGMPWHLPEDLRHFKELTMGHPVIMGRNTWESIPRRPLPGRRNIVLTSRLGFQAEGAETAASLPEALEMCRGGQTPFIIGGGAVYRQALPLVSRLFVTRIEAEFPEADTLFPAIHGFREVESSGLMKSKSGLDYRFITYESSDCK